MRRIVALTAGLGLTMGLMGPAMALEDPPPPPGEWFVIEQNITFPNNTNPCTGENFVSEVHRFVYQNAHTGGFNRLYWMKETTDGWSTDGYVMGWALVNFEPAGSFSHQDNLSFFLYEDEGDGIIWGNATTHTRFTPDGTLVHRDRDFFHWTCVRPPTG